MIRCRVRWYEIECNSCEDLSRKRPRRSDQMRRFILVTGCLAFTFTGAAVHATDCNVPKVACCPSCDAPTPQQCTCSRPAQPQPAATPQSGTRPAQGGYVTPPHRGTYAGETSSLGLDIGGIHVPEMHFHLPTLRLPGLRHLRRNPEFLGDAHTAPYVTAPISQFAVLGVFGLGVVSLVQRCFG